MDEDINQPTMGINYLKYIEQGITVILLLSLTSLKQADALKSTNSSDVYKRLTKAIKQKSADACLTLLDEHYFTDKKGEYFKFRYLFIMTYFLS